MKHQHIIRSALISIYLLIFGAEGVCQSNIPDNTVTFNKSANAYLPVEDIGIHGNYRIKGYAAISNGTKVSVGVSGWTSISTNPQFGAVDYFGSAKLFINGVEIERKTLIKAKAVILPADGTRDIGGAEFQLSTIMKIKTVEVEIEAGYIHETNATPIPGTTKIRVKLFEDLQKDEATLLLFDVSGSMAQNNKWQSAKQSALSALNSIRMQSSAANLKPSISIRVFDGDCTADPTREVIGFTTDLNSVENAINNKVPPPGGGTPLPQSIKISEEKLNTYLNKNGIKKGKLIVLTDGVSTCGSLRPQGVYGYGQQQLQSAPLTGKSTSLPMNYYAVGFDIAPGSEAERDLQYLVQQNGGKYMNAKDAIELTDAFYIFNRVYIPKLTPASTALSDADKALFAEGIALIEDDAHEKALQKYQQYSKYNPGDFNGIYNLALMSEANERYKAAVKNYETYLQLNSAAQDKTYVTDILQKLRERVKRYAAYHKQVVKSDMEFLDMHFKKIQNGESLALAREFIGFLSEKYNYYKNLPAVVELDDRNFKTNANEVFKGLKECVDTINRNPKAWDRDATPVLSRTYLNMERLLNAF